MITKGALKNVLAGLCYRGIPKGPLMWAAYRTRYNRLEETKPGFRTMGIAYRDVALPRGSRKPEPVYVFRVPCTFRSVKAGIGETIQIPSPAFH